MPILAGILAELLLDGTDIELERGVAEFHDVAARGLLQQVTGHVPQHEMVPAGAQAQLYRGGIGDHLVAFLHRSDQPRENNGRPQRAVGELELSLLYFGPPGICFQDPRSPITAQSRPPAPVLAETSPRLKQNPLM